MKYLQLKKNNFCLCVIGKSYLLHHIILTIAHKNLILETARILQIQNFFPSYPKNLEYLFFGQVEIFSGK